MTSLRDPSINVEKLRLDFDLENFVETGCYEGEGLGVANLFGYKTLLSCDINEKYAKYCQQQFPHAQISHLDSLTFFKSFLPTIFGKTLFWLDAHYPSYYGHEDETIETKFPLFDEINLIKKYKKNYEKDVIICDDLRVLALEENIHHDNTLDQYFLTNLKLRDLINLLKNTHHHNILNIDTGVIIFTPKNKPVKSRILINRQHAGGDVLLAEPIVRKLYEIRNGDCIIDFCTAPNNVQCIEHSPFINKVVNNFNFFDYDTIINLDNSYEKFPSIHPIDVYENYAFGARMGISKTPKIYTNEKDSDVANFLKNKFGPYCVLHMRNSNSELDSRNIDPSVWKTLVELIINTTSMKVVVVGSSSDIFFHDPQDRIIDIRGSVNIRQLKEVIENSLGFVGSDSLPAHVANSTNRPSIVLYTSAKIETRMPDISTKFIPIKADIECYGCREHNTPPVYNSSCYRKDVECTRRFDPETIFEQIKKNFI